ncbi:DUF4255 domain-containing protein [Streptomyces sp. SBT349]|uniref:DUF4255 domain-containing protein n=1 Tax=Streptomyces sp. SBT349 TaxID=1580539 RepID=UPI0007C79166|nr:DUF4255 domain-containing protein [Streptomyces sp. SBT349]
MIHEVDETLQGLLTDDVLPGTGVDVVFEAPTTAWAARRNAPTINLFLYDIREAVAHRQEGRIAEHDADGTTVAVHGPPRWFTLSYLVTAWTKRSQDEHRLLSVLLAGLLRRTVLPGDRLTGSLAALGLAVPYTIALPPGDGRALADVWSALGGELKPSLDLVVTAPMSTGRVATAPPVTDALLLRALDATGAPGTADADGTGSGRTPTAPGAAREATGRDETRRPRYDDAPQAPGGALPVGVRRVRGGAARRGPSGPVPG